MVYFCQTFRKQINSSSSAVSIILYSFLSKFSALMMPMNTKNLFQLTVIKYATSEIGLPFSSGGEGQRRTEANTLLGLE